MRRPRSPLHQKIGQRVRHLRQARGLTQFQLGGAIGRSHHFVSGIERGVDSPSLETLIALATALGTSVADLTSDGRADLRQSLEKDLLKILRRHNDPRLYRVVREMVALYDPHAGKKRGGRRA